MSFGFNNDEFFGDLELALEEQSKLIHIKIQQFRGRKWITCIEGIPENINFLALLKAFKKQFCCNGLIKEHPAIGKILQLQGDQRENVRKFLVSEGIVDNDKVRIHGH